MWTQTPYIRIFFQQEHVGYLLKLNSFQLQLVYMSHRRLPYLLSICIYTSAIYNLKTCWSARMLHSEGKWVVMERVSVERRRNCLWWHNVRLPVIPCVRVPPGSIDWWSPNSTFSIRCWFFSWNLLTFVPHVRYLCLLCWTPYQCLSSPSVRHFPLPSCITPCSWTTQMLYSPYCLPVESINDIRRQRTMEFIH